jgi:phytoene dehydrogenase-like protein
MITSTAPYHWLNNWGAGDREAYRKLKTKVREILIRRASQIIPDLPNLIELQDIATPLTFERFTRNSDGATSAWGWGPHQKYYKSSRSINIKTPVRNLLIGSSWAVQTGGVPYAIKAAQRCVKLIGS